MDRIAEWRPVDPAGPDGPAEPLETQLENASPEQRASATRAGSGSWHVFAPAVALLTMAGLAVAAAVGLAVLASLPSPAVQIDSARESPASDGTTVPIVAASNGNAAGDVVVDVEGAVEKPGVWRVATGSRVGDAISAAGGYSTQVDIEAASKLLNLAETVTDGQQIHVPLRGEAEANPPTTEPSGGGSSGGLINVNTATAEQLDTLPGIGPVTASKIIAARLEAPFASIDDLQQRGVVGASTLEKIRSLITVAP